MRSLIRSAFLVGALAFSASAFSQVLNPNPTVLSLSPDGAPTPSTGSPYWSTISADGRWVVLGGEARALLGNGAPPDPGLGQFILLDRQTGQKRLVSVNAQGQGQDRTIDPNGNQSGNAISVSDDGRRVIFNSRATNLAPGLNSGALRCYLWDRAVGHVVAVDIDPNPGIGAFPCGNITADGSEVVGLCSQPVSGTTGFGVCVRDLDSGAIQRLAPGRGATIGSLYGISLQISADASTVAFAGWAGSMNSGLMRLDRATGIVTTVFPFSPISFSISGDGRYLAFASSVYDHATGMLSSPIRRPPFAFPSMPLYDISISRDGRFAAFRTSAGEFETLFSGQLFPSGRSLVYRFDFSTNRIEMVSRLGLDGQIADGSHDPCDQPFVISCFFNRLSPRISGDGRLVVFQFPRSNLAPSYPAGDPDARQLFIKDMGPPTAVFQAIPVTLIDRRPLALLMLLVLVTGLAVVQAFQRR